MKPFVHPVSLNETSLRIKLLHKTLRSYGYPVSITEEEKYTSGRSTLQQVRAVQEKLGIEFDDRYVIDPAAYEILVEKMGEEGILDESLSFTVEGAVYDLDNRTVSFQALMAFDVDLRGVAIYRTLESLKEMEEQGGFEFLGETQSGLEGNYTIEFLSFQFERAERKKADVVVYAINDDGQITGRSRMVNSREYTGEGKVENLDVRVQQKEERTEYEIVMGKLLPFLEESGIALVDLAESYDQVRFTADELDEEETKIEIAVDAEALRTGKRNNPDLDDSGVGSDPPSDECNPENLEHELLYGLGRQNMALDWGMMYRKTEGELKIALEKSIEERIIRGFDQREIKAFLKEIQPCVAAYLLKYNSEIQKYSLEKMLAVALPKKEQQLAFTHAYRNFKSQVPEGEQIDYQKFWGEYLPQQPEFSQQPELISALLFMQQLSIISGNHQPLMEDLQTNPDISSVIQLVAFEEQDWKEIILKTGVPDFVEGENDDEKITSYAHQVQTFLNAAYPTQKIALMLKKNELPLKDANVVQGISSFLDSTETFDISTSRIHEFEKEVRAASPDHFEAVTTELNRMQRVFQVSTAPKVMGALMEENLNSAYTIASYPKKSFIKMNGEKLGGDAAAEAVYQRAEHISALASNRAMKLYEITQSPLPEMGKASSSGPFSVPATMEATNTLESVIPNYPALFGSPDICECEHCRGVLGAAAYLVDLLRLLWRSDKNDDTENEGEKQFPNGRSPLDKFAERRPDLLHLPLTCENTNTLIPYIDLVNEVMEYYTINDTLDKDAVYDTGSVTADELRANPQHVKKEAYQKLKDVVYPFSLPYHQPLDVIRTYGDHLKTDRYEVMKGMQTDFIKTEIKKAIESEALKLSEEEYRVLTLKDFNGGDDLDEWSTATTKPKRQLQQYFGFPFANTPAEVQQAEDNMEKVAGIVAPNGDGIHEFLRRTGVKYADLVELIKTKFINPHQETLFFLERLFSGTIIDATSLYFKLQNYTKPNPSDSDIEAVIKKKGIGHDAFTDWIKKHFDDFNTVITLFQSEKGCALDSTHLKTIENVYAKDPSSGIKKDTWSKIHRFIRLWRKLGWKIHELDLMLTALGESDISEDTIAKLSKVVLLNRILKLPLNKLAAVWGNIETYGENSLYKKLFLNRATLSIDQAFLADKFGNYLTDAQTELLGNHVPAILSAFRMSHEDLNAIIEVATITDNTVQPPTRTLDLSTDKLTIYNLSIIYRYTVLSKALKLNVPDFCLLSRLFYPDPFSILHITTTDQEFINIVPSATLEFSELAVDIKKAGFKPVVLQYIFEGKLPANSTLGLNEDKAKQAVRAIREAFNLIDQHYPVKPESPLTADILGNLLSLTFKPEVVNHLMGIIAARQSYFAGADPKLTVVIPPALATKAGYDSKSGKLHWKGIMTDAERTALKDKDLSGTNDSFKSAVDALYIQSRTASANSPVYQVITAANLKLQMPDSLSPKYTYTEATGRLTCTGVMSDPERDTLKTLSGNGAFQAGVGKIYEMPEVFIKENFGDVFANATSLEEALVMLLDHAEKGTENALEEKLQLVYTNYLPLLLIKLREDAIIQHIASLIGLSQEATQVLMKNDLQALMESIVLEGFSSEYFPNTAFTSPSALTRTDSEINFDWEEESPDPTVPPAVPANNFSVRWQGYIAPPSSGEYMFIVVVKEANEIFKLYLDDELIREKKAADTATTWEVMASLNASRLHKLVLEYVETTGKAGISLLWKTATTALEIIEPSFSFPAGVVGDFIATVKTYHRAAASVSGFSLTDTEVNHFIKYQTDFASINFKDLTTSHWKRIHNYVRLRNAVPQSQALLTDLFVAAHKAPVPSIDIPTLIHLATGWDLTSLNALIKHFNLTTEDFINEIALLKLYKGIALVQKTGLSPETLIEWARPETGFPDLHKTAELVKSTVKAKYELEDWMELAGSLSDKIRENQKQALISYLLTNESLKELGVYDADSLFEYFLIDVQMGACMDTSRIVQANAAVQMFVNRCHLNLESIKDKKGNEMGVAPEAIDRGRWETMKLYRVWEVGKKIFLHPENWLNPEWRDDRSPFFKELESELTQNDITTRSVETAFRNYLTNLNTVANLDVCGMYQENDAKGNMQWLHVFGRTHNAPYQFFYRTCDKWYKWSAWEKVPVDIRMTEDGDNSGVHLLPVVWKNRLFLFWTEFIEKQKENTNISGVFIENLAKKNASDLEPVKYWEMRLAWSEHSESKWIPKQLTKEFIYISSSLINDNLGNIILKSEIQGNGLSIIPYYRVPNATVWESYNTPFKFTDIQSQVLTLYDHRLDQFEYESSKRYHTNFEKHRLDSTLKFWDNMYLQNKIDHNLVFSNEILEKEKGPWDPFFYSGDNRNYFVRTHEIGMPIKVVKEPDNYNLIVFEILVNTIPADLWKLKKEWFDDDFFHVSGNLNTLNAVLDTTPRSLSMKRAASRVLLNKISTSKEPLMEKSGPVMEKVSFGQDLQVDFPKTKQFAFHTFYHPYSSHFVSRLNQDGIKGLMDSDTLLIKKTTQLELKDGGNTFETTYNPNFLQNLVKKAPDVDYDPDKPYTYYKENICFDVYGANSIYNWELFFHAPLYIATRLSKNGKYEEAMKWFHYIFDPTTDEMVLPGQDETARYWKTLPFKTIANPKETLEDWFITFQPNANPEVEDDTIAEWRDDPFNPFLVARIRPIAFMKNVVIKYVENLIEWGDSLFRTFTRENVFEAIQYYVIAGHTMGRRGEFVPKRGIIKAETYDSLKNKWDDFSNAVVQLENIFPYSSSVSKTDKGNPSPGLLGMGDAFYFCIPHNEKLTELYDTIEDRLYKIRHCMDIDGVERQLALFSPPIDPAMLINAAAQGLSLGSILSDLSSPPPIYRFSYLLQKANEFCAEVKSLGSTLLATLEKRDGEELGGLRASHETAMLDMMTAIKERQILDAKVNKEALLKSRETAKFRLQHYTDLLGNESLAIPEIPSLAADLTADSQLPSDTNIQTIKTDVDEALVDGDERGVKLIRQEKTDMDITDTISDNYQSAMTADLIAGFLGLYPQIGAHAQPLGVGASTGFGGRELSWFASSIGKQHSSQASISSVRAGQSAKMASYIRREQDWTLQANLAAKEIVQLDKQITSADIKIQVTEKELAIHKQQIENSKQVERFLKDKFTNQELYQWLKEQLFTVYKQSFNLAYDMAKKVEKCYRYELGNEITSFIQYGYWDNTMQGLCAGEKLLLALRQMEVSYLDENKRQLELTKTVSMALLDPLALQELRTTGKCFLAIPEEVYDLDYQGHYFRKIKSVSLSLPCIAGPYTTVNCTLRLLKNTARINTSMNDGNYGHNHDEGIWTDDMRFRESMVPVKAIAASSGQRDSGMFELNFRDERLLPFEGAGAISEWKIELTQDAELRQFDYSTISDVILHISYTAREDAGLFKEKVVAHLKDFLANAAGLSRQPLLRMFSMKHEFSTEWHKFLKPVVTGSDQILYLNLRPEHFPFFAKGKKIVVRIVEVLLKATQKGEYQMIFTANDSPPNTLISSEIPMPESPRYANMQKATLNEDTQNIDLSQIDIFSPISLKFKHTSAGDYHSIDTDPEEISDVFMVVHYNLGD